MALGSPSQVNQRNDVGCALNLTIFHRLEYSLRLCVNGGFRIRYLPSIEPLSLLGFSFVDLHIDLPFVSTVCPAHTKDILDTDAV